ncbi:hypothetical protein DES45_103247 [Microvirga subterranea]|uniref:Uncharacterized protein n=1 Tax=Microvirga subterranea TaxID=186651 RepID=A0A370HN80_9HYPH|nr:hypothetical protein DES45_103247 [Microvirga subterranea]
MTQSTKDPKREDAGDRVVREHVKAIIRKLAPRSAGPGKDHLSTRP